jgi:hypothetical protein
MHQVDDRLEDEEQRSDHEEEDLFSMGHGVAKAGVAVVREKR